MIHSEPIALVLAIIVLAVTILKIGCHIILVRSQLTTELEIGGRRLVIIRPSIELLNKLTMGCSLFVTVGTGVLNWINNGSTVPSVLP